MVQVICLRTSGPSRRGRWRRGGGALLPGDRGR
jgi:hypothetical protein